MGIGHERGNVYWTFNGNLGALDSLRFRQTARPRRLDHSDGQLTRWVEGSLSQEPGVPSHLAYEPESARVYVADTGHVASSRSTRRAASPASASTPRKRWLPQRASPARN